MFKICRSAEIVQKPSHPCRDSMQKSHKGCNLNPERWGLELDPLTVLFSLCFIVA